MSEKPIKEQLTEEQLIEKEKILSDRERKFDEAKKDLIKKIEKFNEEKHNYAIKNQEELNELRKKLREENIKKFENELKILAIKNEDITKQKLEIAEKENALKIKEAEILAKELKLDSDLKVKEIEQINNLEAEKIRKIDEVNQEIEKLYAKEKQKLSDYKETLDFKKREIEEREAKIRGEERNLEYSRSNFEASLIEQYDIQNQSYRRTNEYNKEVIEEKDQEIQELREELSDLKMQIDKNLAYENTQKESEIKYLKYQVNELSKSKESTIVEMTTTIGNVQAELERLRVDNQDLMLRNNRINELEIKNQKLMDENKDIDYYRAEKEIWENRYRDLQKTFLATGELNVRIAAVENEHYKKTELIAKNKFNNEIEWLANIGSSMKEFGVEYPRRLLCAFHTALKSAEFSPLSVLSGVSGTGKSELPKLYAYFGGFNFLAESVQPTWDSPESMMGYYNTIENKFDSTNILKFIIQTTQKQSDSNQYGWRDSMNMILLDEMNLSHIELYFAEFLSKFEQRRGAKDIMLDIKLGAGLIYNIPLLKNILWVGTMNEDETTKSLSDKVLDRSFSINFPRPDKLKRRNQIKLLQDIQDFNYLPEKTWSSWIVHSPIDSETYQIKIEQYNKITNEINHIMSKAGKAIGHRVWQSMEYYIQNHPDVIYSKDNEDILASKIKMAYEDQLVQKIMPKLRGIELSGNEKKVLDEIRDILASNNLNIQTDFDMAMDNPYGQFIWSSAEYLKENE